MKQKPIEDRFHNARNDQSLVVIEGFHPLKHAIRFGAELLEMAVPEHGDLDRMVAEYAPDTAVVIERHVQMVPGDVFTKLAPVTPLFKSMRHIPMKGGPVPCSLSAWAAI